jgi:hypothetical protein
MRKGRVVAYFGVIYRNFPGGYEKNHEKHNEYSYYGGENLKPTPAEYTSEILSLQPVFIIIVRPFVGPWPLFNSDNPIHNR